MIAKWLVFNVQIRNKT